LWDKAAVVASILSSVVLASLALFLNSTIQGTQVQIQKAQLKEAEDNAKLLERSQNAKATTDLIQYLMSGDPPRQRIALIALRRAVQDDDDLVINVVSVVASTSTDQSVFQEATETLQTSRDPRVSSILAEIALKESQLHDPVRSSFAYRASERVSIQAAAQTGTTIIYAAPPGGAVYESSALQGGVFTQSLISTLQAKEGPVIGGELDLNALQSYLDGKISSANSDSNIAQPLPIVVSSGAARIPIWSPASKEIKMLSIGVSKYATSGLPSLKYPTRDATTFADLMRAHGATVSVLTDDSATRAAILQSIDRLSSEGDGNGTFVLYFSGHGWNENGIQQIAAADMKLAGQQNVALSSVPEGSQARGVMVLSTPQISGSLALSDVMQHVSRLPFRFKLVVIDACSTEQVAR
jgi:hypothetical protein